MTEDEDNEDEDLFAGLFTNEEYVEQKFDFMHEQEEEEQEEEELEQDHGGDRSRSSSSNNSSSTSNSEGLTSISLEVLCSPSASTDHDLTGQVVWPVSVFLSWFIARNPSIFRGQTVLEVGAGCGLPGLVAARVGARTVCLTDGSKVVMRLLEKQKEFFEGQFDTNGSTGKVLAVPLEWGNKAGIDALRKSLNFSKEISGVESKGTATQERVQIIVGADVVCWPVCVAPLLETVKALFLELDFPYSGVMYIGYVCRATNTRDLFFTTARQMGFKLEKVIPESFLPLRRVADDEEDHSGVNDRNHSGGSSNEKRRWPANIQSKYDLELYRLSLDSSNSSALDVPLFPGIPDGAYSLPY